MVCSIGTVVKSDPFDAIGQHQHQSPYQVAYEKLSVHPVHNLATDRYTSSSGDSQMLTLKVEGPVYQIATYATSGSIANVNKVCRDPLPTYSNEGISDTDWWIYCVQHRDRRTGDTSLPST